MEIITTHSNTDFDGLASMVAAGRLYPGARLVLPGGVDRNVRDFLTLHADLLDIGTSRDLPREGIEHVIIVDTQSPSRMGELSDVLERPGVRVTIYDHHPDEPGDLEAGGLHVERHIEPLGATTTILLKLIRERGLSITPFEATLFALGLYFDTGSFTFAGTTADDLDAAAYLRRCGASLDVVSEFLHYSFTREQRALLNAIIRSSRITPIKGVTVALAVVETADYVSEAAAMATRLIDLENVDTAFILARMDDDLYLIGRSRTDRLDVADILEEWGGGGHARAASARVRLTPARSAADDHPSAGKETEAAPQHLAADGKPAVGESTLSTTEEQRSSTLQAIEDRLIELLESRIVEEPRAEAIMSRPARTVPLDASIEEAAEAMQRYGHSGLSVIDDGRLVGVISRRDVDKARHHRLTHAPVKGFMAHPVVTASPDDRLSDLEARMIEHDVGRLPVLRDGDLVGVVTRGDLLRARHGARYAAKPRNLAARLEAAVPRHVLGALRRMGAEGDRQGIPVYLVGGFVRDLLLGRTNADLDLVTEGDAIHLAKRFAPDLGVTIKAHPRFGTAKLVFPDGSSVDLASARTESYARPAALPDVEHSSIEDDLRRRDFTINAMAIRLGERHFGELLDPYRGARDLRRREIRVLHSLSFVEDPTRILRAVRFEARFGFRMEPQTLGLAEAALREGRLGTLTPERLRRELQRSLDESHVLEIVRRWEELGILEHLWPGLHANEKLMAEVLGTLHWFARLRQREAPDRSALLLAALLSPLGPEEAAGVCRERLRCSAPKMERIRECLERGPAVASEVVGLDAAQLTRRLKPETLETLLYAAALNPAARDALGAYLQKHRHVKLVVTGDDLIALGHRPGPRFGEAMQAALDEKLKGRLPSRKKELDYLIHRLETPDMEG